MASTTKISPRECFAETMKSKGFIGLYKGLSPWLYFAVPRCVVRFGVFEEATTHLLRHQNEQAAIAGKEVPSSGQLSPARGFVAGMMAGMIEGIFVVTPMHAIQVRLSVDNKQNGFFLAM
jgi:solute carrier family 25 citrate transporter 1